ncbi:MAG: hypothetical protein Kow00128_12200 [Deltaproteobacteria bacterium]
MERSGRSTPPRAGRPLFLAVVSVLAAVLWVSGPSSADIYRWVDDEGTIHFTDELSNVPPAERKSATLQVREAPGTGGSLSILHSPPPPGRRETGPENTGGVPQATAPGTTPEALRSRIEQLKAKIDAKERHIQAVDRKRSLAFNPLRNRFVEEADLELYRKYQAELPADREELRALEDSLSSR